MGIERQGALQHWFGRYLRQELNDQGDFMTEFRSLPDSDRAQLREWAEQEMATVVIEKVDNDQSQSPVP